MMRVWSVVLTTAIVALALIGASCHYHECRRVHPWWYCVAR